MKEKIPYYNIVNMFFVGVVFSLCLAFLLHEDIPLDWLEEHAGILSDWGLLISAVLLVAMYELGFIINRMGSIIVAPILEKTKIWKKDKYDIDISEIASKNAKFQSMITELVLMRSHIMMCVLLFTISVCKKQWSWSLIFVGAMLVFVFGGMKHNSKINKIRKRYHENKQDETQRNQQTQDYLSFDANSRK
jgi:hypothetical protein